MLCFQRSYCGLDLGHILVNTHLVLCKIYRSTKGQMIGYVFGAKYFFELGINVNDNVVLHFCSLSQCPFYTAGHVCVDLTFSIHCLAITGEYPRCCK